MSNDQKNVVVAVVALALLWGAVFYALAFRGLV